MLMRQSPDDATINEALAFHMLGLSQRDIAAAIGMSQRYVCYLLKRLGVPPNGYRTATSLAKRSRAAAETAKLNRAARSRTASDIGRVRRAKAPADTPWDASWPLILGKIPSRLGYPVFSALSRHGLVEHAETGIQILPRGRSLLIRGSEERIRKAIESMPEHTTFCAGDRVCVLGVPRLRPVRATDSLSSWCVTAKGKEELADFEEWCLRELDRIGVTGVPTIGERRVIRIKGRIIVGYQVTLSRLHRLESLRLQSAGLGGRRRFGCGVFV